MVKLLLKWPLHVPLVNCRDGEARVMAAPYNLVSMVKSPLQWPQHAHLASCSGGEAFKVAVDMGCEAMVELL
jgi:hypothetical protein